MNFNPNFSHVVPDFGDIRFNFTQRSSALVGLTKIAGRDNTFLMDLNEITIMRAP